MKQKYKIVERDWINLYDSIEPLKEPLSKANKKRAYNQRAYMRAYRQRPDVKARHRAYMRAYRQRPDVKAYKRAYNQRPEQKAYMKAYMRAYRQRPDVKARQEQAKRDEIKR